VRDFLQEHGQTQHIQPSDLPKEHLEEEKKIHPLDLNKEHLEEEVDRMYKFAREKLKATVFVFNQSENRPSDPSPYEELKKFFT
jgi:ribosome-binding ATPase YchF (GTP1/OBG family)